ncbi:glycosyltransferase family 9 protein [Shigella sonnei]
MGYSKPQSQGDYAIAQHFLTNLLQMLATSPYFFMQQPEMINTGRIDGQESIGLLADSGIRIKLPWGAPHEEERAKRLAEGFAYVGALPKTVEGVARYRPGVNLECRWIRG